MPLHLIIMCFLIGFVPGLVANILLGLWEDWYIYGRS